MYSMKEACALTNMTYENLKFYCNEGLVPNVKRDKNNRRVFDERDVAWIGSLTCLKKCGMSIQEMKEYLAMCLQRPAFPSARKCWRRSRQPCGKPFENCRTALPTSTGSRISMMKFSPASAPTKAI